MRRGSITEKRQLVDDSWRCAEEAAAVWLARVEQLIYRIGTPAYRAMCTFNGAAALPLG